VPADGLRDQDAFDGALGHGDAASALVRSPGCGTKRLRAVDGSGRATHVEGERGGGCGGPAVARLMNERRRRGRRRLDALQKVLLLPMSLPALAPGAADLVQGGEVVRWR